MRFLITGGTGGIGRHIVAAVATAGHHLCFTYHSQADRAASLIAQIKDEAPSVQAHKIAIDLRNPKSIANACDSAEALLGGIDVLVGNAAANLICPVPLTDDIGWSSVIATNLTANFLLARHFAPAFMARRRGRFIFISSVAAGGMSGQAAYAASKAALIGLSGTLARECGPRGVTSNIVTLGLFDSGMGQDLASQPLRDFWSSHAPSRRLGRAAEAAQAVLYLASDAAAFVNGQNLSLTGGLDWAP